jgi:hypothetical protein
MMLLTKMVLKLLNVKNVLIDVILVISTKIHVLLVLLSEKESMLVTVNQVTMKMLKIYNVIHVHTIVKPVPMPLLVNLVHSTPTEIHHTNVHVSPDISKTLT